MAKVSQMNKNHTIVSFADNGIIVNQFFSYDTLIAEVVNGETYFSSFWNYSKTTSKYLNQYTGMDSAETKADVKAERIKVVTTTRDTERLTTIDKKGNIHVIAS